MMTPQIRFNEFDGQWEKLLLGDIFTFKNGVNASKEQYGHGVKFINVLDIINNDFITYENIIGSVNITATELAKNDVEYGDILFQRSSETREEVGQSNVYLGQQPVSFGGFVIRGRGVVKYDALFFHYALKTDSVRDEITQRSGGSTRYNIGQESLSVVPIVIPSIPEQTKIANFLTAVDEKISLLTRKHDLLTQYKKGVMQQIFSQELRFQDDDEREFTEWTVSTLGNVCRIKTGKKDVNQGNPSGQYPFFTCAREHTWSDTYSFEGEAILIAGNGEVGNLNYCNGKFEAYQRTYVLQDFSFNTDYLWQYLKLFLTQSLGVGKVGSSVPYIKLGSLTEFDIFAPSSKKEQTKIANFLTAIDDKITTAKTQLKAVKQYKQGLLQQMFV